MGFIEPTQEAIITKLQEVSADTPPLWGEMNAVAMIEHLSDVINMSYKGHSLEQIVPEDKVERAQQFLSSEHPMPKNFQAAFAVKKLNDRHENVETAIHEFAEAWKNFEDFYKTNPTAEVLHPNFGMLPYNKWLELHSKHITHHLEQFGVNV